jgi:photosystem II stability/assembly factor-like uncharacterized protein
MRRLLLPSILTAALTTTAAAQWTIQTSATTADLRGIDNVGNGTAWASGTAGTILRTTDNGTTWTRCTTPPAAEALDFRGIQAFDAQTAIVMSSGKGDLSRLYKTTDGCQTWKLLFINPDKDGFFDAIKARRSQGGKSVDAMIVGDPVQGSFTLFEVQIPIAPGSSPKLMPFPKDFCRDKTPQLQLPMPVSPCIANLTGAYWRLSKPVKIPEEYKSPKPRAGETLFAASNSSLAFDPTVWYAPNIAFVTGGPSGARFIQYRGFSCAGLSCESWRIAEIPLAASDSSGGFSLAAIGKNIWQGVIVGGDYKKPDGSEGAGAYTIDEGKTWHPSDIPPHGYRSAVAYDAPTKTWITVGPNGTDISTDDGRNWHPLKPSPPFTAQDTPDADRNWNALSLPFVVGPKGRIGHLRQDILTPTSKSK